MYRNNILTNSYLNLFLLQNIRRSLFFLSVFMLIIFIQETYCGANDLHFNDGSSTYDIIAGDVFFEIIDPEELAYTYRIRPAKDFGAPFNDSVRFRHTRLIPAKPIDACSEIHNVEDVMGQVVLVERGECSFVYKTMQAEKAGARAVVITEQVHQWDHSLDHLIEMVDDKQHEDINIPAGFLLGRSGSAILRTLNELGRQYALINLPVNLTHVPVSQMNQPPWIGW